jgi:hypothetical protein
VSLNEESSSKGLAFLQGETERVMLKGIFLYGSFSTIGLGQFLKSLAPFFPPNEVTFSA